MRIKQKEAVLNGNTISYFDAGAGYPIILLHGFPQNKNVWRNMIPLLTPHFRVLAPDTRGQGDSSICHEGHDKKTLASDVISLMDECGIKKALIVGHDWGGSVAQRIALEYPERISGLISTGIPYMPHAKINELCHPQQIFKNWYFFFHQVQSLPEIFIEKAGAEYINWMLNSGSANKKHPEATKNNNIYSAAFCDPNKTPAYLNIYRTLFTKDPIDWKPYLSTQISIPTLWIRLIKDPFVPPSMSATIEQVFQNLKIITLDYGHWLPEEAPALFVDHIMQFSEQLMLTKRHEALNANS